MAIPANAGGISVRDRLSIRGRVLDLSIGAAKALGMIARGVILVRADVL
jgi:rare lipoprotein A (peptidoglycan hydrolase)